VRPLGASSILVVLIVQIKRDWRPHPGYRGHRVHGPFWDFKIFARFQKIVYSGIYHWVSYIDNIRGYSSAFYHSMPSFAQRTSVCFRQVLRLCLVMPASMSPGPRTPLPKMCLPVWAVPHVAGTLKSVQTSVYSAYSLPFHHKLWMKIFYLVLFKSLLLSFVSACDLAMPHFLVSFQFEIQNVISQSILNQLTWNLIWGPIYIIFVPWSKFFPNKAP